MCSGKYREKKGNAECCSPEQMQNMIQMMDKFRSGRSMHGCSFMMEAMKGQSCCGPETEKAANSDYEEKKDCC